MADTENREDQKISECLREAFGYSDDQLLKQLDQANETFKDVNFTGAEDRLMKRFLARKAELEKETASQTPTLVPQNESANIQIAEELPKKTVTVISEAEEKKKNEKKVIRFGKKKVLATAALVAVIAGMLGGTAIGKKSYFFRKSDTVIPRLVLDNAKNKVQSSKVEAVYQKIEKVMGVKPLKLGYYPLNLEFVDAEITADKAKLRFTYNDRIITFIQEKKIKEVSIALESDRRNRYELYNEWMQRDIEYCDNLLPDGQEEFEMLITIDNIYYYFSGMMPREEYETILKNLNFF